MDDKLRNLIAEWRGQSRLRRIERAILKEDCRELEVLLAEPQSAPPSLSAEQWAIETATKLGYLSPIASDRSVMILKNALSAATKPINGTLGLDGDTQRDWASDGPALEKRVKELEGVVRPAVKGASPICLDCNKAGLRNCSHFDNCEGAWVYKPGEQREAEIRGRVLEEAAHVHDEVMERLHERLFNMCQNRAGHTLTRSEINLALDEVPDEPIRALKSQVSVTGETK